MLKYSGNI